MRCSADAVVAAAHLMRDSIRGLNRPSRAERIRDVFRRGPMTTAQAIARFPQSRTGVVQMLSDAKQQGLLRRNEAGQWELVEGRS